YSTPSNGTVETYAVWQWEVTFVTKGGDLPLMAAVWWNGRTSTGQDGSFGMTGRSARLTCASCEPFENGTWSSTAEAVVGNRIEVQEVIAGSSPISGTFSLIYPGHAFQEPTETAPISVHASAGALASELTSLDSLGINSVQVSRSGPSAEGELAWTVSFVSGNGDLPAMQAVHDGVTGTDAVVRVAEVANGVAPVRGSVSLVVSGVRGEAPQATAPLAHDASVDTVIDALSELQPIRAAGLLVEVERKGPFVGGGYSWSIALNPSKDVDEIAALAPTFPMIGMQQANVTGTGARVRVEKREAHEAPPLEHLVSLAAPLPTEIAEVQDMICSLAGMAPSEAALAGASFVVTFRGETTEAIAADTVLNPGGLPSCGQFATGPCQGDGTTLKERLEALLTVGEVNVTGITSDGIAGDDAEICGVDSVSIAWLDGTINAGDLPLMSAVSSNATLMHVEVVRSVKGSAPFVREVQRITITTSSTSTSPTAGTFSIVVGRNQTSPLAYNISESDLALSLEKLPGIRSEVGVNGSSAGDSRSWTVTFMSPGPQSLLASPCEEDVVGNGTSPDCLLENASVKIRRIVRGKSPASGTFRLGLVPADGEAGSTNVAGTRTTGPIPFDATADELHAAVVGVSGGQDAKVTVAPNARAEYGFEWGVTLFDNGISSVELVEVDFDDPGPWCADGVTGPAAAGTSCEFPFAAGQDGSDVHFSCAGAVGSSPGWCSTIPTFNDSQDWGGCVRCEGISLLSPPTIHVASLRRSFRLRGELSQVSQALSEIVYHPRTLWNAWLGGHDEVSAYWYDENSLDGSERLSGAKARSVSQVFVAPVNDPPTIDLGKEARLVHEGEELLLEDAEILDPDLTDRRRTPVRVELEAMSGTLAFGDSAGLTFTSGSREPHSSQRLVVKGALKTVQNAMRQVYYRPLPVFPAGTTAGVRTTLEVQRVELTAPIVPMVQSVTTSTTQGYIEGNFTLSVDCSAFFEEVDNILADVNAVNQTTTNSSETTVESTPIAAEAPATGNGSMETGVRELLSECVSLAWDRANVLMELSNATSVSGNSSSAGNFTRDALPHRGATAVVSRGEPDVHGGVSWMVTMMDVPHSFPALGVGANNLTGSGVGLDGSQYVFDGTMLSGTPSISVDVVQAQSSLSGPNGTFTLTATPGKATTRPIPTSASGDEVAAALTSLADVGALQVSTGPILASPPATPALGQYWEITFLQSGSPIQIGDLPLLEARGVGFDAEGAALRVFEVTKGRAPRDSVTIRVNDLGNVGEGGSLEATAAWNITIVPKHVAPVVHQVDDGTVHPGDFLRTFEGTVLQLPSLQVSYFPAFEAAGDDSSNDLQYLVRITCSRGSVKPTSSAAGQDLAVTMPSTTATLLSGKLPDINRALSNLGYYAPRRYRGVDDVEVAARVAGFGFDGGWGATKLYAFVDGVNDPPELSAPRSATSKGATPTLVGGISVTDDDSTGIITISVEAARGLVSFPHSHRLKQMGASEDVTVSNSSIVAYGQLQDISDALSALTYTGQSSEFSGTDSITLKVVDAGGLTASRIVKVEVEASTPPKITRAGRLASLPTNPAVDEDGELLLDALHISVSDSAVESTVQVEIVCTKGAVSLPLSEQEPELWTSTDEGHSVIVAGKTDRVNRALRSLVYRPDADVWGSDQLSIVARARNDNAIGSNSGWNTVAGIKSIVILVDPVNDPPTIHIPDRLAGGVLPLAFAGEVLPLGGIVVHDADAGQPGGSQLVSVSVSAVGEGSTVSLAMSNTTVQGRLPGVLFLEGSAEGVYTSISFRAPLHLANSALDLLQFSTPFRQPSGLYNVSISVSDHGNWGKGEEETASASLAIDVRYQDDPLVDAGRGGLVQWDTPHGALSVDEDGHLHDLGIALRADVGTVSAAKGMWVDASLEVDHGLIQMPKSGAQINGETVFEVVRYGPGSLTVSGAVTDVSVALADSSYTPEPNFHGVETLALSVRDHFGEGQSNASVDVVVFSKPDPPTIAVDMSHEGLTAEVGSRLVLHGVEVQHVDALDEYASGTVTLRAHSTAKGGTIAMNKTQPGLWVYTEETGGALVARGSVENLQIALDSGALEYVPSAGYDGLDVVSLSVSADSPYGAFGGESSALQGAIHSGTENNATAELHINVVPTFASAAVIFDGGPLFRTVEGSGIDMAGIKVRAPGRRNTSDIVLSVNFETAHGSVTVREAASTRVIVEGKGRSAMSLTGKELDINMALEGAVFNGDPFYNGVADVKV
ncbi:unnamed protein product, partial [Ectocarpus sp. 8 AP-2014]